MIKIFLIGLFFVSLYYFKEPNCAGNPSISSIGIECKTNNITRIETCRTIISETFSIRQIGVDECFDVYLKKEPAGRLILRVEKIEYLPICNLEYFTSSWDPKSYNLLVCSNHEGETATECDGRLCDGSDCKIEYYDKTCYGQIKDDDYAFLTYPGRSTCRVANEATTRQEYARRKGVFCPTNNICSYLSWNVKQDLAQLYKVISCSGGGEYKILIHFDFQNFFNMSESHQNTFEYSTKNSFIGSFDFTFTLTGFSKTTEAPNLSGDEKFILGINGNNRNLFSKATSQGVFIAGLIGELQSGSVEYLKTELNRESKWVRFEEERGKTSNHFIHTADNLMTMKADKLSFSSGIPALDCNKHPESDYCKNVLPKNIGLGYLFKTINDGTEDISVKADITDIKSFVQLSVQFPNDLHLSHSINTVLINENPQCIINNTKAFCKNEVFFIVKLKSTFQSGPITVSISDTKQGDFTFTPSGFPITTELKDYNISFTTTKGGGNSLTILFRGDNVVNCSILFSTVDCKDKPNETGEVSVSHFTGSPPSPTPRPFNPFDFLNNIFGIDDLLNNIGKVVVIVVVVGVIGLTIYIVIQCIPKQK